MKKKPAAKASQNGSSNGAHSVGSGAAHSANGKGSKAQKGGIVHCSKGHIDPKALRIHVIRINEIPLKPRQGCHEPAQIQHKELPKVLRQKYLRHCHVKRGQKVRLIGSTEPSSAAVLGMAAARFEKNLGRKRSMILLHQLCVNGGDGSLAVDSGLGLVKAEFSRTHHVIMALGRDAFALMIDELHDAYCKSSKKGVVVKASAQRSIYAFNRKERAGALMVTFYPALGRYRIKVDYHR